MYYSLHVAHACVATPSLKWSISYHHSAHHEIIYTTLVIMSLNKLFTPVRGCVGCPVHVRV